MIVSQKIVDSLASNTLEGTKKFEYAAHRFFSFMLEVNKRFVVDHTYKLLS